MRHRAATAVASVAMRHSLARATAHRIARAAPRSRLYQAWRPASDAPAADASRKVVAIVYGSFDKDLSLRDAEEEVPSPPPVAPAPRPATRPLERAVDAHTAGRGALSVDASASLLGGGPVPRRGGAAEYGSVAQRVATDEMRSCM